LSGGEEGEKGDREREGREKERGRGRKGRGGRGREGEEGMTMMWLTLIWSRRAVAMFVCMSILFFFSISSGRELAKGGKRG